MSRDTFLYLSARIEEAFCSGVKIFNTNVLLLNIFISVNPTKNI